MCWYFEKRGHRTYPVSVVQAGHHRAQQIDRQSAQQTAEKENADRILFILTFKLLQNDSETGTIFSQAPLISFKRDKNRKLFGQKFISNQWPT